jgi:thioredoxin-related protein
MKNRIIRTGALLLCLAVITSMRTPDTHEDGVAEGTVNWMTFEQAIKASEKTKKKIFIDVYTDWCGWCKVMDRNTFNDPNVSKILNEDYYPVKFNAEQREDVMFKGQAFKFVASGTSGYHQLAATLLNNQLSYPTVVFLDEEFNGITPLAGYKKPEEFHRYLVFIRDEYYKKGQNGNAEFQKNYKSPYAVTNVK